MFDSVKRSRSISTPVTQIELRELNKYKDKKICKEDLEILVKKYKKESKVLNFFRGLPPEINIIQNIVNRYNSLVSQRTLISCEDKEVLSNMIAINK